MAVNDRDTNSAEESTQFWGKYKILPIAII